MFRKRNSHADPHSLMSELLATIEECLASADVKGTPLAATAKSVGTTVALQQVEQAAAQPAAEAGAGDAAQ